MDRRLFFGLCIIGVASIVILSFLGFSGMLTFLVAWLVYVLPAFLFLGRWDLGVDERLLFAFFLSLGFVGGVVYYTGYLFGSVRVGLGVAWLGLMALGYFVGVSKHKKQVSET